MIERGLVGYWSAWVGATGFRLLDRTRYANHGTLTNMDPPTDWVGANTLGRSGRAINIQDNQSVNCGLAPALNFTSPFSAMVWIRNITSNTGTDFGILSKSLAGWNILCTAPSGGKAWAYWNSGSRVVGATTITQNTNWQLIGIGWTGAVAQVWVNGLLDGSASVTTAPNAAGNDFHIGRYVTVPNRSMVGDVADVAAWNRALAAAEWRNLYRLGPGWFLRRQQSRRGKAGGVAFKGYWARRQSQVIGGGF